jgi:transposase
VHTGGVMGQCGNTRTGKDLEKFMGSVAKKYYKGKIHIIWDNLNIHRSIARWTAFNERHKRRFFFHFTPLHASWVNQVELWFGILGKRCLRNASFTSKKALRKAVLTYISVWEEKHKKPFIWTFQGYPLQSDVKKASKSKMIHNGKL